MLAVTRSNLRMIFLKIRNQAINADVFKYTMSDNLMLCCRIQNVKIFIKHDNDIIY